MSLQPQLKKIAIITTHPIQYYAPLFKLLHQRERIAIKVFYTAGKPDDTRLDPGFNKAVNWDIPLIEGYPFEWVENTSAKPGSHYFNGIVNPGIISQIMLWSPDAILVYGWAYSGHLKVLRYFKNKLPVYFRGDSTLLNEDKGAKGMLKQIFLKWVYRHVDHAFYVGLNNKDYFKRYGLNDRQLTFAPHAIDNVRFEAERPSECKQLRYTLGLAEEDILLLYAGKFEPVKNLSLLLRAFISLNKPHVHLLLAGSGADEEELKMIALASNATENIHFTGFTNQSYMPVLYQAADVVCLASASETWGLAINEAMACSRAVLVSDKVGCAADLVRPGFNGEIFKSGDEAGLVRCIAKLTADKAALTQYGCTSHTIIKDWNFTKAAEAIENRLLA